MFSEELYRIGLYTPLWSESNPPPAGRKKFHSSRILLVYPRNARRPRVTLPSLARTSGPSAYDSQLIPLDMEQDWPFQATRLTATSA